MIRKSDISLIHPRSTPVLVLQFPVLVCGEKSACHQVSNEYYRYPLSTLWHPAIENGSHFALISVHLVLFMGISYNLHYPLWENVSVPTAHFLPVPNHLGQQLEGPPKPGAFRIRHP